MEKIKLNKPYPSNRKFKKFAVDVKDKSGKIITVHFGDKRYEDYTQHRDIKRRDSFRARHKCDKEKDKTTARYWACEYLWSDD